MRQPHGRLLSLVESLDKVGAEPSLAELGQVIRAANLAVADVADYVLPNERGYHRATVALREQYELLVMTWLPGQASVPHDHAGSVCVMQVLQGSAVEGSYRLADDGYVDFDFETTIDEGRITAGQDAGIHTVRNPAAENVLVTMHCYAPPLREFRRFLPRPSRSVVQRQAGPPTVVIVGGGFSGVMTAAQLLRQAAQAGAALKVALVERRGALGEGLAYGTREVAHLLNVPAGRMSAWGDRPNDFVEWVSARIRRVQPTEFLPRQWYGDYVRDQLLAASATAGPAALSVVYDEVRRVARHPAGGWVAHIGRGQSLHADAVVLAIGHRPPRDPIGHQWTGPRARFVADPWRPFGLSAVGPDEPVLVLGTGLTAVDAVLSLAHPSRTVPITLISRNGRLPQAHAPNPLPAQDLAPLVDELVASPPGLTIRQLLKALRIRVQAAQAQALDWRQVIDGLRPHSRRIWQALSTAQRSRFMRHARALWEVHRHRMAPDVAGQFNQLVERGLVQVIAGRVASAQADEERVAIEYFDRNRAGRQALVVNWVVNCTGPLASNTAASNPAIGSLLVDGWLRPDDLELGLETREGRAIDAAGQVVPDLFVVGTLRKPDCWESTAVPELREQAAAVAAAALARCAALPARA